MSLTPTELPESPALPPPPPAAGELADVLVHELSALAVQAEAAEAVLRADPAAAADSLAAVRGSALEALADMRRLLRVLRSAEDPCGRMPQPGLDQLPALVGRAMATGQPVTLKVAGSPRPLGRSFQLAAYRVIHEALVSAREHAPGATTTVNVTWSDADLEVAVCDAGPGGRDLTRLEERVRLHGGRLDAGKTPDGRYRVCATFPA